MEVTIYTPKDNISLLKSIAQRVDLINNNGFFLIIQYSLGEEITLECGDTFLEGNDQIEYFLLYGEEKTITNEEFKESQKALLDKKEKRRIKGGEKYDNIQPKNAWDDKGSDEDYEEESGDLDYGNVVTQTIMSSRRQTANIDLQSTILGENY